MTQEPKTFKSGWRERMTALRNLPPVLKIVWQSGPLVVTLGGFLPGFRFVAADRAALRQQAHH